MIARVWIVVPVSFESKQFLKLYRRALDELSRYDCFLPEGIQFVAIDCSAGEDKQIKDLRSFHNIVLLSPEKSLSAEQALVFGLRTLRGTVREEDVVITLPCDEVQVTGQLRRHLGPIIEDFHNPHKLILSEEIFPENSTFWERMFGERRDRPTVGIVSAAFRGWLVQFKLSESIFDLTFSGGLLKLKHPALTVSYQNRQLGPRAQALLQPKKA